MSLSKKEARDIAGFTFSNTESDSENWANRARAFKNAAELIAHTAEYSPPVPFYFNAGLSLELILKAIAVARKITFDKNHDLNFLYALTEIELTEDQKCTLELLSAIIVWSGRYPTPKNEGSWNNYHDIVLEKHIVRNHEGNTGSTLVNQMRFPNLENYLAIWAKFESTYISLNPGTA